MPVHPEAIKLTSKLQNATRCYLLISLNESADHQAPHVLSIQLQFPACMIEANSWLGNSSSNTGLHTLYVELAPVMLLPCAVYTIMGIAQGFRSGAFNRNAAHVLQASVKSEYQGGMVFMVGTNSAY